MYQTCNWNHIKIISAKPNHKKNRNSKSYLKRIRIMKICSETFIPETSDVITLHFTLHTLHSTLHTLHCTLHTWYFTLRTLHFTLRTLHFTLHTLHFTHSTLCIFHSKFDIPHSTHYTLHFTWFCFFILYVICMRVRWFLLFVPFAYVVWIVFLWSEEI